jgi:hypothetical protein
MSLKKKSQFELQQIAYAIGVYWPHTKKELIVGIQAMRARLPLDKLGHAAGSLNWGRHDKLH